MELMENRHAFMASFLTATISDHGQLTNHGPGGTSKEQSRRSGQVRGVEEDTSALSSRRSCQARSARNAPRTTCIATATPAKAIPSLSPKLSRRQCGGGGGGRWWWWWCCGWCGGGGALSESDATRRGGAWSGAGLDGGGSAAKERDGEEERRRKGRRSVKVAARRGGRGAVDAMGALAAYRYRWR